VLIITSNSDDQKPMPVYQMNEDRDRLILKKKRDFSPRSHLFIGVPDGI
jgi:hypothetical protein